MTKRLHELKQWAKEHNIFYQKGTHSGLWYCYKPRCSDTSLENLLETIKRLAK
jgi:hypothetical protein